MLFVLRICLMMSDHSVGFSEKPTLCLSILASSFVIAMLCSRFCVTPQPIGREEYRPCPPAPAPTPRYHPYGETKTISRMLEKMRLGDKGQAKNFTQAPQELVLSSPPRQKGQNTQLQPGLLWPSSSYCLAAFLSQKPEVPEVNQCRRKMEWDP